MEMSKITGIYNNNTVYLLLDFRSSRSDADLIMEMVHLLIYLCRSSSVITYIVDLD